MYMYVFMYIYILYRLSLSLSLYNIKKLSARGDAIPSKEEIKDSLWKKMENKNFEHGRKERLSMESS